MTGNGRFITHIHHSPPTTHQSYQQRIETRLAKMDIRREGVAKTEFAHDPEAEAIGEGPVLIVVLQKEPFGVFKAVRIHPFNAACPGGKHRLKERSCQMPMTTRFQEGRGLIQNVIRCHKSVAALASTLKNLLC